MLRAFWGTLPLQGVLVAMIPDLVIIGYQANFLPEPARTQQKKTVHTLPTAVQCFGSLFVDALHREDLLWHLAQHLIPEQHFATRVPGFKLPLFYIIGNGHQPNSRGLYIYIYIPILRIPTKDEVRLSKNIRILINQSVLGDFGKLAYIPWIPRLPAALLGGWARSE